MFTALRLRPFFVKYRKWLFLSAVCHVLMASFTVISIPLVIPFFRILFNTSPPNNELLIHKGLEYKLSDFFTKIIDTYGSGKAMVIVCIALILAFFLRNLFRYLSLICIAPLKNGIIKDLRENIHSSLLYSNYVNEKGSKTGDIISRATTDLSEVEWSVLSTFEAVFKSPFILLGSLLFMLLMNVKLTLIALLLMLFTGVFISGISRKLKSASQKIQNNAGNLASIIEETIHGWKIISIFSAQAYRQAQFKKDNEKYYRQMNLFSQWRELSSPLSEFLGVSTVVVLLWYGSDLVFDKEILPETFFAFILAFYQLIEPSKQLSNAVFSIQKGNAALERIYEITDLKKELTDDAQAKLPLKFNTSIEFRNVTFSYSQNSEPVLKNINCIIKKGQKTGLTGFSGSGKSTFADLLLRINENYEGQILLDNVDIKNISLKEYRRLFGYVTQNPILFNDTVAANIALNTEISPDLVNESLLSAHAYDFIMSKPDGMNFKAGEKGSHLSGGEKQRLTIARSLYHQPEIMILDEATSALDAQSEELIQSALDTVFDDKTALVITHKLNTLKNMDNILVLSEGTIAESGTYEELIQNGKEFQLLWEKINS